MLSGRLRKAWSTLKYSFSSAHSWCRLHPVASTLGACIVFVLGLLVGLLFAVFRSEIVRITENIQRAAANQTGVMFLAHIYQIDLVKKTAVISWLIMGCGAFLRPESGSDYYNSKYCGQLAIPIDIFMEGSANKNVSYSPHNQPIVKGKTWYLQSMNEFQTTHLFEVGGSFVMGETISNPEFSFPWDQYHVTTSFIVVNHDTNATVPILAILPSESADGLVVKPYNYETTNYFNGTANIPGQSVYFMLTRSPLVKAFSMIIFLVNWMLVGMILFITVVAFVGKKKMPETLSLLPITIILIVPSLRALMVNSPAFGILLDVIGFFPQMIFVSIWSFLLLFRTLKHGLEPEQAPGKSGLEMIEVGDSDDVMVVEPIMTYR